MRKANIVTMLCGENLQAVTIQYKKSEKTYSMLSFFPVEVGDEVIVDSPFGGLTVVKVVEVKDILDLDLDVNHDYKFLVAPIDISAYTAFMDARKEVYRAVLQHERQAMVDKFKADLNIKPESKLDKAIGSFKALFSK